MIYRQETKEEGKQVNECLSIVDCYEECNNNNNNDDDDDDGNDNNEGYGWMDSFKSFLGFVTPVSLKSKVPYRTQFYQKDASKWTPPDFECWLNNIFIEERMNIKGEERYSIRSILKIFKEKQLWTPFFEEYIEKDYTIFNLKNDLQQYSSSSTSFSSPLSSFLLKKEHEKIIEKLLNETTKLLDPKKNPKRRFHMDYTSVLKKLIRNGQKKNKGRRLLFKYERDLNTTKRYLWNVEDCLYEILCILMFHKGIEKMIEEKENQFEIFEKKELEEMRKKGLLHLPQTEEKEEEKEEKNFFDDSDDEEEEGEEKEVEKQSFNTSMDSSSTEDNKETIKSEEWEMIFNKFKKIHDCPDIEKFSFALKLKKEQNELRKQYEQLMMKKEQPESESTPIRIVSSNEIDGLNKSLELFGKSLETWKKFLAKTEKEFEELVNNSAALEDEMEKINQMEKKKQNFEKKILEIEENIKKTQEKKDKYQLLFQKQQQQSLIIDNDNTKQKKLKKEVEELKNKIEFHTPCYLRKERNEFLLSDERRIKLHEFILNTFKKSFHGPTKDFVVKLCLSKQIGVNPEKWQANVMKYLGKFYTPDFIKWGFLHAYVLVANLGIHWFSNSLVFLDHLAYDGFEQIIALDTFCPFVVNFDLAMNRLRELAKQIVDANVNYQYSEMNVLGKKNELNCQQFSDRLLQSFQSCKFFPPQCEQYIKELKERVQNHSINQKKEEEEEKEEDEKEDLKFFTPDEEFIKTFGNRMDLESFKEDGGKKKRVVIRNHKQLDALYRNFMKEDELFKLHHTGYFFLLKGFDRAFWSVYQKDNSIREAEPSRRCPFNKNNRYSKEENVQPEKEKEKEEEKTDSF